MAIILNSVGNKNITGYSVVEDATPIDVASTEGGVGSISFGLPETLDSTVMLFDTDIQLDDDWRGTTSGTINKIGLKNGIADITAENRLGVLVGMGTTALPKTGSFESVARYYLSLANIDSAVYFDDSLANIQVTAQGWNNDAWLNLKQLCQAHHAEIALVSNRIVFRPIRSLMTTLPLHITDLSVDLEKGDIAKAVEITYYDNVWSEGGLVYPRNSAEFTGQQIYSVEAGQILEDDITLSASLASIMPAVCVDDVQQQYDGTQTVYAVRAADNSQVTAQNWAQGGGKMELTINPDTTSVHVKITGSNDQTKAPFRIAGRVKELIDPGSIFPTPSPTPTPGPDPTPTPTPTPGPIAGTFYYADVSRWQGSINWASYTLPGAMIKAGGSDSGTYTDAQYVNNVAGARTYGKHVGHYWFNGAGDPTTDANYYVAHLAQYQAEDYLILDVESGGSGTPWTPAKVLEFFTRIQALLPGAKMMVYMSESSTDASNWSSVVSYGVKLWVANWGSNSGTLPSSRPTPSYWTSYTLWQYTSVGKTGGVSGNVDLSYSGFDLFPPAGSPTPTPNPTGTQHPAAVDDYPWKTSAIGTLSPLRYGYRECVDFVAWRLNRDAGVKKAPWKYTWAQLRPAIGGNGDAIGWKKDWQLLGWAVDIVPYPGAIAWWGSTAGVLGHVAYVQAVVNNTVILEEYNWGGNHSYHTRTEFIVNIPSFLSNPSGNNGKALTSTATAVVVPPDPTPTPSTITAEWAVPPVSGTVIDGWSGVQLSNAAAIMNAAIAEPFGSNTVKAMQVGVMTAMGESSLKVLDYGDSAGPDSRGLFQQRTSWGTLAQRMDPYQSAILFYDVLKTISGWENMTPSHAAHAVQINADPEYYTQFVKASKDVVAALYHTTTTTGTQSGNPSTDTTNTTGGTTTIPNTSGDQSEQDYASLRIVGTGTLINPAILTIPTSAAADRTATDVGITAQNIYVSTIEDAYHAGAALAARYRGENHTISGTITTINQRSGTGSMLMPTIDQFNRANGGHTIGEFDASWTGKTIGDFNAYQTAHVHDTFENQVFGNIAGARFKYNNAFWRVVTATITESQIDFTATRDTMIEDFNFTHPGYSIGNFNAQYAGMTLKQFGRVPLLGG